ncbi:GlcG/HbpS family heme-binding protein [Sabulicella glaciei]|uniref:Heme-binding protein n=1 Tax=Sabulicella glaciei TaxID=2984948 RepID=A0ABT3NW18_9PROT|nr:heme-binding protein [Roseococcus sp. MDT2-1-1]MCW8086373.1 heme-binding protein [Roseococcus sp. MDT2-1-1]
MDQGYFLAPVATSLRLDEARRILDATLAAGREAELLPLTVVVLDAGAQPVATAREDGCGTLRFPIARGKAEGALGMGIGSRTIRDRLKERVAFQASIAAASDGRFVPVPGGVLILDEAGQAVGAVGVSGDASDRDEYAAIEGIHRAGFASHPAEPAPGWQEAGL